MLSYSQSLILLLGLAFLTDASHASELMLSGSALSSMVFAQSHQDCDSHRPNASARVIYHDGNSAPISVPVDAPPSLGERAATASSSSDSAAPASSLPSTEAVAAPKVRGGGLRWQSVLPGSIK